MSSISDFTNLPTTPVPGTPSFETDVDAWVPAFSTFAAEMAVAVPQFNGLAAQANSAIAAADANKWTSGETITEGDGRYSPSNYQSYRATTDITSGANTIDPATDTSGNWVQLSAAPSGIEALFEFDGAASAGDPLVVQSDGTVKVISRTSSESVSDERILPILHYPSHRLIWRWNDEKQCGALLHRVGTSGNWKIQGFILDENDEIQLVGEAVECPDNYTPYEMRIFEATGEYMVFCRGASSIYEGECYLYIQGNDGSLSYKNNIQYATSNGVGSTFQVAAYATSTDTMCVWFEPHNLTGLYYSYFGLDSNGEIELKVDQTSVYGTDVNATYCHGSYDPINDKFLFAVTSQSGVDGRGAAGAPGSSSVTWGSVHTHESGASYFNHVFYDALEGKPFVIWNNNATTQVSLLTLSTNNWSADSDQLWHSDEVNGNCSRNFESIHLDNSNKTLSIHNYDVGSGDYVGFTVTSFASGIVSTVLTNLTNYQPSTSGLSLFYSAKRAKAYGLIGGESVGDPCAYRVFTEEASNLTTENFIGFAKEVASDGEIKMVSMAGSINASQTGLTPGQKYYVQPDGSVSTTKGYPIVGAGKAISSTEIVLAP